MRTLSRNVLATLLMTGAVSIAYAQDQQDLSKQPVASVSKADERAEAVAQALVADPEMQGSKITVQAPEDGIILLTGVTRTRAQMRKAVEAASQVAGEGKVANAIKTEELVIEQAPTPEAPQQAAQASS